MKNLLFMALLQGGHDAGEYQRTIHTLQALDMTAEQIVHCLCSAPRGPE